ncbi:MAG: 2Fe-2S iron-sulfur cluster-binding protein, partial [Anaerolineae bacterium]
GMFIKLGLRRAQAISVVNIAVVLSFDNGKITDARITLGSVAPIVVHAQEAERTLIGEVLTEKAIARAAAQAVAAASPIDDVRGPAEYRREMCRVLTEQALTAIMQERERADFPAQPVMLWGSEQARVTAALPESFHHTAEEPIETTINGVSTTVEGGASKTLLRMLREDAGLIGTKEGCAEGECGACTVFLDGAAVMACMVAAPRAHRAEIVTIEGLAANGDLHPVQRGFIEAGAVQCGYCTPGFIMAGAKLLEETATPSEWQIQQSITGNLCRCTGYYKINMALLKAAQIAARED